MIYEIHRQINVISGLHRSSSFVNVNSKISCSGLVFWYCFCFYFCFCCLPHLFLAHTLWKESVISSVFSNDSVVFAIRGLFFSWTLEHAYNQMSELLMYKFICSLFIFLECNYCSSALLSAVCTCTVRQFLSIPPYPCSAWHQKMQLLGMELCKYIFCSCFLVSSFTRASQV